MNANFPEGSVVVLVRHSQSDWNKIRTIAHENQSLPPMRLPGKRDAHLSAQGRVEACLAGELLGQLIRTHAGRDRIDIMGYSLSRRAEQTANILLNCGGFKEPGQIYHGDLLDERRHAQIDSVDITRVIQLLSDLKQSNERKQEPPLWQKWQDAFWPFSKKLNGSNSANGSEETTVDCAEAGDLLSELAPNVSVQLMISFCEIYDYKYRYLLDKKLPEDQCRLESMKYALTGVLANHALSLSDWVHEQRKLEPYLRRKTPWGEDMVNVGQRAARVLEWAQRRAFAADKPGVFVFVTHSLFMLGMREVIEGLGRDYINHVMSCDGPPFPPNAGIVAYKSINGCLRPLSDKAFPYLLPPELVPHGRKLQVPVTKDMSRIQSAALKVGATMVVERVPTSEGTGEICTFRNFTRSDRGSSERPGLVSFAPALEPVKAAS